MDNLKVNVAVIGAGTAGLAAYRAAVAEGARAVLIEGGPYGTTCARVGCMPSKLLIAAAEAAHSTHRWPQFGIQLQGTVNIDGKAVMARVKRERDRFVGFVLEGVEKIPATDKLRGHARFIDDYTLQVDDHTRVNFERAVIATGSSPNLPPLLRTADDRLIVNDDIFDWDDLPQSVAVFGAGVIGLELGQALHRLGVSVRIFGRNHSVGPFTDPEIRAYATKTFQSEFYLDANAVVNRVQRVADGVAIHFIDRDGIERTEVFEYVVAATGRKPNLSALALENTRLTLDANGVPTFSRQTLQCGNNNIFIAGDVNDDAPLLHEAADEGRIAGQNAARSDGAKPGLRRVPLGIVFSEPQLAVIGSGFNSLTPGNFVCGRVSFEDQGRSRIMLRNQGLLHVYADVNSGRLLGAELIGPDAEHLAHLLSWAIQCELTVDKALEMPFYHPVVEEGLRTALRSAQAALAATRAEQRGWRNRAV
ncbi:MAG: dihydrolipoyl dehydrogenase [Gammaproteobacteria bacterium]